MLTSQGGFKKRSVPEVTKIPPKTDAHFHARVAAFSHIWLKD